MVTREKSSWLVTLVLGVTALFGLIIFSDSGAQAYDNNGLVSAFDISNPDSFNPSTLALTNTVNGAPNAILNGSATYDVASHSIDLPGSDINYQNNPEKVNYYEVEPGFDDFSHGITIQSEFNFGSVVSSWERILDFGNGEQDDNFLLGRFEGSNELIFELEDQGNNFGRCVTSTNDTAIELNVFATWTLVLDGVECHIYKNGVELNTRVDHGGNFGILYDDPAHLASSFPYVPNAVLRTSNLIGASNWSRYDEDTEGSFRSILLYNRALAAPEVVSNLHTVQSISSTQKLANTGSRQNSSVVVGLSILAAGLALYRLGRRQKSSLR